MIKLSDYVAEKLVEHGIQHVFMIAGGGAMHLVDSVGKQQGICYICPHYEQAAAISAEGYARTSGKMGVVIVTSGPGGTNTITGVIGQWLDSVPVLYLSGQVKFETTIESCQELGLRQLGDQEINIVDIVRTITKYAIMVTNPEEICFHLEKAIYLATHGRPGPVWLDIPLNVQAAMIDEKRLEPYKPSMDEIKIDQNKLKYQVSEIIQKLKEAKRPVLLVGQGIRLSGGIKEFDRLIDKLNVPVLTAICGHDLIPSVHPLFFGRPGICGDRLGNFVVQNSDFLIAIGARLGIRQISYNYDTFARNAYKVMVDIDKNELKKPTLHIDLPIHADAKIFMEELLMQLNDVKIDTKLTWLEWCRERKRTVRNVLADNPGNQKYVNSYSFADKLFSQMKKGDVVVTGNGTAYTSTYQVMDIKKGIRVFANQGCASMGYDLPAAIGASIALDKKPVILITGDGSIQMNLQELQTIVSYDLPIKIFVLNNHGYLSIRITQDTYFNGRYYASDAKGGVICPNMFQIAKAYGIKTTRIRNEKNLLLKIEEILSASTAILCEIMMDPQQPLYPKLSSEVKPDGKILSKPLEDMFPFLPRGEFAKHMIINTLDYNGRENEQF